MTSVMEATHRVKPENWEKPLQQYWLDPELYHDTAPGDDDAGVLVAQSLAKRNKEKVERLRAAGLLKGGN